MARLLTTIVTGSLTVSASSPALIVSGGASISGSVSGSFFFGDGRYLTNVTASAAAQALSAGTGLAFATGTTYDGSTARTIQLTTPVTQANGGLGASIDGGDRWGLLYKDTTTTTAVLSSGSSGQILQSNGSSIATWITATDANTASTIVKRGGSGQIAVGEVTATGFTGSGANITNLNAGNVSSGILNRANGGWGESTALWQGPSIPYLNSSSAWSTTATSARGLVYIDGNGIATYDGGTERTLVCMIPQGDTPVNSIIRDSGEYVAVSGSVDSNYEFKVYGDLGVTGTIYETSTIKIKENVKSLQDELSKIMMTRPVEFDYIESGIHSVGFIAEELNEVYPDAVMRNDDNEPIGVAYADMVSPAIRALQQIAEKLDALTARVEALEKNANNG